MVYFDSLWLEVQHPQSPVQGMAASHSSDEQINDLVRDVIEGMSSTRTGDDTAQSGSHDQTQPQNYPPNLEGSTLNLLSPISPPFLMNGASCPMPSMT